MNRKLITILLCLLAVTLAACSQKETIDGTWAMVRQEYDDGTVYEGDSLPVNEYYIIDGEKAKYICRVPGVEKDVSFSLNVAEVSKGEYEFKVDDRLTFQTGKIEGKQLKFDMGDGQVFFFEKTDAVPERTTAETESVEKQTVTPDCAEETVTTATEESSDMAEENALKVIKEVSHIDVSSLPEGYNYAFDEPAQISKVTEYLNGLHLISRYSENPDEYDGMTWVVELSNKDGVKQTIYLFGNMFARADAGPWFKLDYEEAEAFEKVLGKQ